MSEPIKGPGNSPRAYESSEVSTGKLFAFALGVVGLILAGVLASAFVFHFFVEHQTMGPPASPFEDSRAMPPELRLQTTAPLDLKAYHAEQDKVLSEYGWVDQQAGVVRIPVDRAMDLLLQKGYPVQGKAPANGPKNTPGAEPPPANRQVAPTPVFGEKVQ